MFKLQRSPLALPLLFFICGIGVSSIFISFILFFIVLVFMALWHSQKLKLNAVQGYNIFTFSLIALSFFLLGVLLSTLNKEKDSCINERIEVEKASLIFTNGVRFTSRGCWTIAQLDLNNTRLHVQVNIDSLHGELLEKGDTFMLSRSVIYPLIKEGKEASGFENYLLRQGVQAKLYVNNKNYVGILKNNRWEYLAYNFMHAKILYSSLSASSKSLLLSLLIGDRGYIDKMTKDKFSALGVSHILSVSGLHVGIIYLILAFVISLIWNKYAYFSVVFILSFIWFYCWMVGFEAAVLRSALMFSLHVIGNCIGRKNSLLHTTSLSAFIILLINPSFLFDIGFQLTFGAMVGIIFLMPLFQNAIKIKSAYLKPVADLVLLSVAVQLTLLPLLIFHFQTLPVYFVFANLLVVPAVALIMYAGIMFLLLPQNDVLNTIVDVLVKINDGCCNMMCQWPYPMLYIKHTSLVDYCFYSLSVSNMVLYCEWKMNAYLWIALLTFTVVFI